MFLLSGRFLLQSNINFSNHNINVNESRRICAKLYALIDKNDQLSVCDID